METIEKIINTRNYLRKKLDYDVSAYYWIETGITEGNVTNMYCKDCVEDILKYLVTPSPEEGKFPHDGMVDDIENVSNIDKDNNYFLRDCYLLSDTPEYCYLCQKELSTILTEYGINEELEYLEEGVDEYSLSIILHIYESLWYIRNDELDYLYNRASKILEDYEKLAKD